MPGAGALRRPAGRLSGAVRGSAPCRSRCGAGKRGTPRRAVRRSGPDAGARGRGPAPGRGSRPDAAPGTRPAARRTRSSGTPITATSRTWGRSASRFSTSAGKTFSPPDTIMSSSRPSTKTRPSASRWPRSPVASRPSCRLPGAAVGVALEEHLVADEEPPDGAGGQRAAGLVEHHGPGAVRRPARRVRRGPQVGRGGDGRPGDLGGAVQVVEDVAVAVHEPGGQPAGQRRSADRDHPQRRPGAGRRQLHQLLQHHRHGDHGGAPLADQRGQRGGRLEAAAQHDGGPQRQRDLQPGVAPGVEQRRGDHHAVAGAQRDPVDHRAQRAEAAGRTPQGALGHAGGAGGQHDRPARPRSAGPARRRGRVDQLLEPGLADAVEARRQLELVVVDQRPELLVAGDGRRAAARTARC